MLNATLSGKIVEMAPADPEVEGAGHWLKLETSVYGIGAPVPIIIHAFVSEYLFERRNHLLKEGKYIAICSTRCWPSAVEAGPAIIVVVASTIDIF